MGRKKTDHIRFERVLIREQVVVAAVPRAVHRDGRHTLLFTLVRRVEPRQGRPRHVGDDGQRRRVPRRVCAHAGVPRAREHAIDRGPRPLENLLVQARRRADPC